MKSCDEAQIHVRLIDEAVEVWRPVRACRTGENAFLLIADQDYRRDDEKWEFEPGSTVFCEARELIEGTSKIKSLVAIRSV